MNSDISRTPTFISLHHTPATVFRSLGYTGGVVTSSTGSIKVFSLSVYARLHFLKYLYLGAGPILSINTGDRDINGIGAGAVFGGEYTFSNRMVISFGPYAAIRGLLPGKTYKLLNTVVTFSLGYKL